MTKKVYEQKYFSVITIYIYKRELPKKMGGLYSLQIQEET